VTNTQLPEGRRVEDGALWLWALVVGVFATGVFLLIGFAKGSWSALGWAVAIAILHAGAVRSHLLQSRRRDERSTTD
jgi:hypothetical protein